MNASGNEICVAVGEQTYYFSTLRAVVTSRVEDTALVSGELYRVRAAGYGQTFFLKGRISLDEMSEYIGLLRELAQGANEIEINGEAFESLTLLSGRVTSGEGEAFGECEITLVEVAQ